MRIPASAVLAVVVLACADRPLPGPQSQQRDSSGITIVENGPVARTRLNVNPTSVHTVGGDEIKFSSVAGAVVLGNGNILVADSSQFNVRLFDSAGHFVKTVVEKGNGPAQLNRISRIFATSHDSVYVVGDRVIIVLGPHGEVLRKIADYDFRPDSLRKKSTLRGIVGVLDDGSIVTEEENFTAIDTKDPKQVAAGSMRRAAVVFRRGTPGGAQLAVYANLSGRPQTSKDRRPMMEGPTVALAAGNQLFYAPGDTLGFVVASPDGNVQRITRVARARTPAPRGSSAFIPDVIGFALDDSVRLWVTSFDTTSRGELTPYWYVFTDVGILQSEVRSEQRMFILAIRRGRVLGAYNNAGRIQLALFTLDSSR